MASKEVPAFDWICFDRPMRFPETVAQAVMEAAPHEEPERAHEEVSPLGELICEVIDDSDPDTRLLLEAVIFERLSFRQLEQRFQVPKSVIHRMYAAAILELRAKLIEYPEIVEYLDSTERNER